jgi:outer membrane lipoprotein
MKRYIFIITSFLITLFFLSCAPVVKRDLMDISIKDFSLPDLTKNPNLYKGKLFALGGIIVKTKVTSEGSLIEALYVAVDSRGYLEEINSAGGRFLALFPKEKGLLDPVIFRSKREITIIGEFIGTKTGKIDETKYTYPLFKILDFYLWEEPRNLMIIAPYYNPYPYYMWGYPYSRWNSPYWGYPYYPVW